MSAKLLIVDDDRQVRFTLRTLLEDADLEVLEAEDGVAALEQISGGVEVDLVLSDIMMPRLDGIGLLSKLVELGGPPVVLITAKGSERTAVEAMKHGALDYFPKPFDENELLRVVHRNLTTSRMARELRSLRATRLLSRTMVFESAAMMHVAELVERVGPRDIPVLITGESGTGKELVARALVAASQRANGPFVPLNCAALSESLAEAELFGHAKGAFTGAVQARAGLFREADGGTLFLDEVGELSPRVQAALLRVLQEHEVRPVGQERAFPINVRVITATNRSLATDPGFRSDLYYRLNVMGIHLPPLRARPDDVVPLARSFLNHCARDYGMQELRFSPQVESALKTRPWPGNVRELRHMVERLAVLSHEPEIKLDVWARGQDGELPQSVPATDLKARVDDFERNLLEQVFASCDRNQSEAARRLGVSRMTLVSKLKKFRIA